MNPRQYMVHVKNAIPALTIHLTEVRIYVP